jgi:CubicO group peptidase (beta-lactamase class C family)
LPHAAPVDRRALVASSLILASCRSDSSKPRRGSSAATTATTGFASRVEAVRKQAEALAALAPGVIVSLRDGNDRKTLAIGSATRDPERAIVPEDTVMIASVTKALVATAALSLVQDGSLRLDDTVEKWLPGLHPRSPDHDRAAAVDEQRAAELRGLS